MQKLLVGKLLFATWLVCLFTSLSIGAKQGDNPTLLLYAFSEEGTVLENAMEIDSVVTLLGRRVACGVLEQRRVVLAESGVGMTNAAATTQFLIDTFEPSRAVFSGIAGGIDSSVHIGDIIVCSTWTTHDYGYLGEGELQHSGVDTWLPGEDTVRAIVQLPVDSALFYIAKQIEADDLDLAPIGDRVPKLIVGAHGASGNAFIDSETKREWLDTELGADIVDMESAAVAQVCTINNVPFLIFRSASDLAGGSGSETANAEVEEFFRVAAENSSEVVLHFLRRR